MARGRSIETVILPSESNFHCPPRVVLENALGLLLSETRHDGDKKFVFFVVNLYVLFFKVALDSIFLELSYGCKALDGVPGKSADRPSNDQVDIFGESVLDYILESDSLLDAGVADSLIGVDVHEFPDVAAFDVVCAVVDLCFIAGELVVMVR